MVEATLRSRTPPRVIIRPSQAFGGDQCRLWSWISAVRSRTRLSSSTRSLAPPWWTISASGVTIARSPSRLARRQRSTSSPLRMQHEADDDEEEEGELPLPLLLDHIQLHGSAAALLPLLPLLQPQVAAEQSS